MTAPRWWQRLTAWLRRDAAGGYQQGDANAQNDLARRAQFPELTDAEYNARFHPNEGRRSK